MNEEVVVNCLTGEVTVQGDTCLATKLAPLAIPMPSFALLAAAGTGATGSVVTGSNDTLMAGTVHTGTSPTSGDMVAVTFGTARATVPLVISCGAMNTPAGTLIAKNITTTGFTISTSATPTAATTYTLYAHVVG